MPTMTTMTNVQPHQRPAIQWRQAIMLGVVLIVGSTLTLLAGRSLQQYEALRLFALPRVNHSALITCAANEHHQIGAKMVADLFEMRGWRGFFLGANAPYRDVLDLIAARRPEVACLSLTVYFNLDKFIELAEMIRAACPDLPILAGGQALRMGGRDRVERIAGARYLGSLAELDAWIVAYSATVTAP